MMTVFAMRRLAIGAVAMAGLAVMSSDVSAQPGGRRGGFGGPGGGGGLELLFRDDIREEIELVDEQMDEIREAGEEMRQSMRSVFQDAQDLPEDERRDFFREKMQEGQEQMQVKLKEILLDHQFKRLEQLALQTRLQRGGAANALESDELRDKLNITEDQMAEMQLLAEEAQEELQKKIQEATLEARNKVLSVLTPEQRATFDEMVGEEYQFQNRGRFGRGGFQGGRQRGQRGQRGRGDQGDRRGGPRRENVN